MKKLATTRRAFLQTTAAGAVGIILARPKMLSAQAFGSMRIEEPFHGAVLNRRHGKQVSGGLKIQVSGQAPLRDRVTVNGTPARREGTRFISEIVLSPKQTEIIATSRGSFGRHEDRVRVLWDRHSQLRYRFSIDDNSFFLRDIAKKNYASLFDSGIVFSRVDIVCNSTPIERIVPTLEPLSKDPNQAEIMDIFTHEQYFWPFYSNYLPDHFKRLDVAIRWVTGQGYKPVFFHEGFMGGPGV